MPRTTERCKRMNISTLIIGLMSSILGLIGFARKRKTKDYPYKSYTGPQFLWSIYLLLGCGGILIIWSFFWE